ncbi:MAG: YbgA family protein [Methanotrichaceae archaeon]|nr:YbgA family protein [Methanotrichaceae archaeon]
MAANCENLAFPEQVLLYGRHLAEALKKPAKYTSKANVLMHSLGYFSDKLSPEEKSYFLQNIEKYKKKRISFSALLVMLQSWIARFDEDYLRNQTFFEPFPEDLIELAETPNVNGQERSFF